MSTEEGEFVDAAEQGGQTSRRRPETAASAEEEDVATELAVQGERLHWNVENSGTQQPQRPDGDGSHPSRQCSTAPKTRQCMQYIVSRKKTRPTTINMTTSSTHNIY